MVSDKTIEAVVCVGQEVYIDFAFLAAVLGRFM